MGTTIRYIVDELRTLFAETERRIAVGGGTLRPCGGFFIEARNVARHGTRPRLADH